MTAKRTIATAATVTVVLIAPEQAAAQMSESQLVDRVRAQMDQNADGVLSQGEYDPRQLWGMPPFSRFDQNGDGVLTGSEFTAAAAERADDIAYECDFDYDGYFTGDEASCVAGFLNR